MFDYARNMKLGLADTVRRTALKAGAGVVILLGAGFLLAALWTFLAHHLDWGSLGASLAIGVLFMIIGSVVFAMSRNVHHEIPSTDELQREVTARASLATDAALDKAKFKATQVIDEAENRVSNLMGSVGLKAHKAADRAESQAQHFVHDTLPKAAKSVGVTPERVQAVSDMAHDAKESRATPVLGVISAFAVGIAIASKIQDWRARDDYPYDDEVSDFSDDMYR